MSLDVNIKKLDEGFGEIFKIGINLAEEKINEVIQEYKELESYYGGDIEEDIRREGETFYDEKIGKIREFYEENFGNKKIEIIEKKYFLELNKMIDSKINEVKNYQPKK